MSAWELLLAAFLKPFCLMALVFYLLQSHAQHSAAWRHQLISLPLIIAPLLLASPWLAVIEFKTTATHTFFAPLAINEWLIVAALYTAIALTPMCYRAIERWELTLREKKFANAPKHIQSLINQFGQQGNFIQIDCRVAPSDTINAYVWRPGLFKPMRLVISRGVLQLTDKQQQLIIAHECAHLSRRDWQLQQWAFVGCCLLWPMPLMWRWLKKMQALAEEAADDKAIHWLGGWQNPELPSRYAELLLAAKNQCQTPQITTGVITSNSFYLRLNHILTLLADHSPMAKIERRAGIFLSLLWLAPLLLIGWNIQPAITKAHATTKIHWLPARSEAPIIADTEETPWQPERPPRAAIAPSSFSPAFNAPVASHTEEIIITVQPVEPDLPRLPSNPQVFWAGHLPKIASTPTYPRNAQSAGIEGKVTVQFSINAQGQAQDVQITQAEPQGWFEESVIAAMKTSEFEPAHQQGEAVVVTDVTETFVFTLVD